MSDYIRTSALQTDPPGRRIPWAVEFELTTRCNLNCRHCHINQSAVDRQVRETELSASEILAIAGQAVDLGTLWCLLTGGEPLLRNDFETIYIGLKKAGLLVSVFTNATCVQPAHIDLFRTYPPRDIEVSVYGVTPQTVEAVTRVPGAHTRFLAGLTRLREGGIPVRLKSVLMQSNVHEHAEIARFCRQYTKDYYRFDPYLNLRFDRDPVRNQGILAERLTAEQIVTVERADPERIKALCKGADALTGEHSTGFQCDQRFQCGAGQDGFTVGADGLLRLCSSLWADGTTYDLRGGSVADAWNRFIPQIRNQRSTNTTILDTCHVCPMVNLCMWCPANAHLETGDADAFVPGFCALAHKRAEGINQATKAPV